MTMGGGANSSETPADLWASLCRAAPALQSARLDGGVATSKWTVRDVVGGRKRQLRGVHALGAGAGATGTLFESTDEGAEFVSTSGRTRVRFTERDGAGAGVEVSVWSKGELTSVWKVDKKTHGGVFNDIWFGRVAFSPDEKLFVYVADRPIKSGDSWIDGSRGRFGVRDVLGEQYVGKRSPALFLADVDKAKSVTLCPDVPGVPESENHDFYGDPQWSPDGSLIAVCRRPRPAVEKALEVDGVADNPYNLGVVYCYNRYSSVEVMTAPKSLDDAPNALESLTPISDHKDRADFCCYSPRFTPDSKALVYVSAPRTGDGRTESVVAPHNTTKILRGAKVELGEEDVVAQAPVTILDVVQVPKSPSSFPGLYIHSLPKRPWIMDGDNLLCVMTSLWGSEFRIIAVPVSSALSLVDTDGILDVTPKFDVEKQPSVSVVDICGMDALLSISSPVDPHALVAYKLLSNTPPMYLTQPSKRISELVRPFSATDLVAEPCENDVVDSSLCARAYRRGIDDPALRYQVTLLVPRAGKTGTVPLCVYPHGGPHSACVNSFSTGAAFLLSSGFAVLYVNYRGSTGQGQTPLDSLPGHAGTQDVSEVLQATKWALGAEPLLDANQVVYTGGSHGGFLGCHVSAVTDSPFKAVALRNPVVNIASMVGVSDIPEWTYCESGAVAKDGLAPDPVALQKMWQASPVARIARREHKPPPTILFVGGSDRRVPPEQSVEWHRAVTDAYGAGIVEMRWYEKSAHPIDEVPEGDDVWVHAMELFQKV